MLENIPLDEYANIILMFIPKFIGSLLALWLGFKIINMFVKWLGKLLERKEVDVSLRGFLSTITRIALKVMLVVSVISMIGVNTSAFVAAIGAIGLAIGLSLQGSLSNFAGGVLIVLLKPFKVGDYIVSQGHGGTVHSIQIFHTILKTPDNVTITLPNGAVANNDIVNYSVEDTRRLEFIFGISYGDDIAKAKEIILKVIKADDRIFEDPAPLIAVGALADSSVNITTRVWCKKEDFWDIHWDMYEKVKNEFDANGISIPFPQRDVHLFDQNK